MCRITDPRSLCTDAGDTEDTGDQPQMQEGEGGERGRLTGTQGQTEVIQCIIVVSRKSNNHNMSMHQLVIQS